MAYGHNRYAAFNHNILHRAFASQHFPRAPTLWRQLLPAFMVFNIVNSVNISNLSWWANTICIYNLINKAYYNLIEGNKYSILFYSTLCSISNGTEILVTCGIPYANTYGIPRNSAEFRQILLQKIPRNSAEFRGIPYVFQKIPYSVGSQKRTSVDTLVWVSVCYFTAS